MRALLLGVVVVTTLVAAEAASAGCWATVGLAAPPPGTAPGEAWAAEITVLQHGRNPLPEAAKARPQVTIVNADTGTRKTFTAVPTDVSRGVYEASVVFPSAGSWRYEVFDGFTPYCAQTHTSSAVSIGGGASASGPGGPEAESFPLWAAVGGGILLLGALGAAAFVASRRSGLPRGGQA
jgi:hypothetical protein